MYSNEKAIDMFNQMIDMGDYYSSGRPVCVDPDIIIGDILSKIPLAKDDVVLDVGCGTGLLTTRLARKCRHIYAVDPAGRAVARFREKCLEEKIHNIEIHEGMATDLPFADQSFNKVIMYAVLHYLENEKQIERCIRELIRVCKINGHILVGEIPERKAKEEFDTREKTKEELKLLEEFNMNRKEYDRLFQRSVALRDDGQNLPMVIDGDFLVRVAKREGCTAKIHKQDIRQSFSLTRRDLVIYKG